MEPPRFPSSSSSASSVPSSPVQQPMEEQVELPPVPSARPVTAEERRARQRIHVRRSYYRKLNKIQTMRAEVAQLEAEYAELRRRKEAAESVAVMHVQQKQESEDDTSMLTLYKRLTALKVSLREQNVAMKETIKEFDRFNERLQHIVRSDEDQIVDGRCPPSVKPPSDFPETEPFDLVPLTAADCQRIAMQSYQEICQFMESHSFVTTGAPIFGWRDRRQEIGDHVKFTLQKHFPTRGHEELSDQAWRIMSAPKGLTSLYSHAIELSIKTLQVVDDDNVVMYRVIFSADRRSMAKTLFLVTRFTVGSRTVILFRTIDRERFVAPRPSAFLSQETTETALDRLARKEGWMEMFTWTMYDAAGTEDEQCLFNFGGVVYSNATTSTRLWMMEILFLALRFEAKVIGPLFALEG